MAEEAQRRLIHYAYASSSGMCREESPISREGTFSHPNALHSLRMSLVRLLSGACSTASLLLPSPSRSPRSHRLPFCNALPPRARPCSLLCIERSVCSLAELSGGSLALAGRKLSLGLRGSTLRASLNRFLLKVSLEVLLRREERGVSRVRRRFVAAGACVGRCENTLAYRDGGSGSPRRGCGEEWRRAAEQELQLCLSNMARSNSLLQNVYGPNIIITPSRCRAVTPWPQGSHRNLAPFPFFGHFLIIIDYNWEKIMHDEFDGEEEDKDKGGRVPKLHQYLKNLANHPASQKEVYTQSLQVLPHQLHPEQIPMTHPTPSALTYTLTRELLCEPDSFHQVEGNHGQPKRRPKKEIYARAQQVYFYLSCLNNGNPPGEELRWVQQQSLRHPGFIADFQDKFHQLARRLFNASREEEEAAVEAFVRLPIMAVQDHFNTEESNQDSLDDDSQDIIFLSQFWSSSPYTSSRQNALEKQ